MILTLESDVLLLIVAFCSVLDEMSSLAATCSKFHAEVLTYKGLKVQDKIAHVFKSTRTPGDRKEMLRWFKVLSSCCIVLTDGERRSCLQFEQKRNHFKRFSAGHLKRTAEFDTVFHTGEMYVISSSGSKSVGCVESYDVLSNTWRELPSLPAPLSAIACASNRNHLFVTGGRNSTTRMRAKSIYMLHCDDESTVPHWQLLTVQLQQERSHHGCAFYQGRMWVAGGFVANNLQATELVESLCVERGEGIMQARMARKRIQPRLLVIRDALYAVGGEYTVSSTIERYDTLTHSWMIVTEFPIARAGCAVAALGCRIYVFGGGLNGSSEHGSFDFFDTVTSEWGSSKNGPDTPYMQYDGGSQEWIKHALAVTVEFGC